MGSPSYLTAVDAFTFRQACSQFATGVAVATARAEDGCPHGLTVSSFTPVSIEPPLILVCIDRQCTCVGHFVASPYFAVNILTERQSDLSVAFAAKPEGRFEGIEYTSGLGGAPLLEKALASIECRRERVLEAGDHVILFGEVFHAELRGGNPLLYFQRAYRILR